MAQAPRQDSRSEAIPSLLRGSLKGVFRQVSGTGWPGLMRVSARCRRSGGPAPSWRAQLVTHDAVCMREP